jgi:hypothetical protein
MSRINGKHCRGLTALGYRIVSDAPESSGAFKQPAQYAVESGAASTIATLLWSWSRSRHRYGHRRFGHRFCGYHPL